MPLPRPAPARHRPHRPSGWILLPLLIATPVAWAGPLVETVVTVDQLNASGGAGENVTPLFGRYNGAETIFLNRPAGDRLLRVADGGSGSVGLEVLFGSTAAPDTGNPIVAGFDWGFTGDGSYVLGASRSTQPDAPLVPGVYTRAEAGSPLQTFATAGDGLPGTPRSFAFDGTDFLSGFVLDDRAGADEGAYLRVSGNTQRLAAVGDPYANAPGVTAAFFSGVRYDLGGRTLATVIEGSDGVSRLTSVGPGNGGTLRSLLAVDEVITDGAGDSLRVRFFDGLVAEQTDVYARVDVRDLDAPFREDEREALVRIGLGGVVEVLDRTQTPNEQLGGGFDFLRGGLAVDGDTLAYQRSGEGFKEIWFTEGDGVQRLIGVGDDFLGGTLSDFDFVDNSLAGDRLLITAAWRDAAGDTEIGLYTVVVPEPAAAAGLLLGLVAATRRRRSLA